ncbi:hypothetical protein Hanom_Chr16g01472661 [Helianthus anomalus]
MVVMRNVGAEKNLEFGDQPDRYVITTEKDRSNEYGNRCGILSWAYDEEKGMFLVKRGNGAVEYYSHSNAFESWTTVDLRELSRAPYHDQTTSLHCKIGWNFYNRLHQQSKVNFKDMKLAKSFLLEHEDALDPATNKPFMTVIVEQTCVLCTRRCRDHFDINTIDFHSIFYIYSCFSATSLGVVISDCVVF